MVKIEMPKPLVGDDVGMAQMAGYKRAGSEHSAAAKRAGDIHKEMVEGFDKYHARLIKSMNTEIKRSM